MLYLFISPCVAALAAASPEVSWLFGGPRWRSEARSSSSTLNDPAADHPLLARRYARLPTHYIAIGQCPMAM